MKTQAQKYNDKMDKIFNDAIKAKEKIKSENTISAKRFLNYIQGLSFESLKLELKKENQAMKDLGYTLKERAEDTVLNAFRAEIARRREIKGV